ncbi:zf-TFIIB domain-containing protein [Pseudomonas nitroreducens]|uniref:Zf-TFIIB domain-containing protein n=1 Tax=Pseudomonas nitroreducens TaxID=46680 RepID=A0ABS0KQI4_PSENT|nr:zf-TFIIB domain-containing protein [Pseudomonas nitroreducens]MBG6289846.1 zf-TFIIB domain-containing protein [Pseudomonas nitroreducens]MDG9857349.1 zf-TFIIB domain-containing protein [Pseudomonas nitroreducens]MDH1076557.1 zf-TFIIB domain-containing protein [Pseudomonas nitroreducens]
MQCPVCKDIALVMTERQSIEIDYCPQCRGVWLDRGELDKIIERSQQQESVRFLPQKSPIQMQDAAPVSQPGYTQPVYSQHGEQLGHHGGGWRDGHQSGHQSGHHNQGGHHGQQTHHRKSFLREMFD